MPERAIAQILIPLPEHIKRVIVKFTDMVTLGVKLARALEYSTQRLINVVQLGEIGLIRHFKIFQVKIKRKRKRKEEKKGKQKQEKNKSSIKGLQ
jgi:hypothetical protein